MISEELTIRIENLLKNSLRTKFQNHSPEPSEMPFHTRLLGKDRLALYQFIHSLNTNFGTTIFEPVAKTLASDHFKLADTQQRAGNIISSDAFYLIDDIMNNLTSAVASPDKQTEIEKIRSVCQTGEPKRVRLTKIDIKLISHDDSIFLCDLKTAKPNSGEFKGFKRTLLEWTAATLYENPEATVNTIIAIPYNPYHPRPYARWTMTGMIDIDHELKVAEELWDFLGGDGTYTDLLGCFERVGVEMRDEIDEYFSRFQIQVRK